MCSRKVILHLAIVQRRKRSNAVLDLLSLFVELSQNYFHIKYSLFNKLKNITL